MTSLNPELYIPSFLLIISAAWDTDLAHLKSIVLVFSLPASAGLSYASVHIMQDGKKC